MYNPQIIDISMQEAELLFILFLLPFSQQKPENASEAGATSTQEKKGEERQKHSMDYASLQCYNYSYQSLN